VRLRLEKVAGPFTSTVGIVNAGDDRLFVIEQEGWIEVLERRPNGSYRKAGRFLDIQDEVDCCGEKGFLGLAFPPDYAERGRFYITYSAFPHTWMLEERRVSPNNPNRADPDWRRRVLRMDKPRDYHWGGNIVFGPDGYLWIGIGDGGFGGEYTDPGDPDNRAQDIGQMWGKILRINPRDPDGQGPERYSVPEDNPFVRRRGAAPEVWSYGFRNPWRWSFDRLTGDLWIADVGFNRYEEVNRARAPRLGKGFNYGWRLMEGPVCYNPPSGCQGDKDLTMPLATYEHETTSAGFQCAAVGGYVYRGRESPALRSWYVLGDYCSGAIYLLDSGGPNRQRVRLGLDTGDYDRDLGQNFHVSAFGEDVDGEIYVADYRTNGSIWRLVGRPDR
jgi:glucose/arabinose dehydrogenase